MATECHAGHFPLTPDSNSLPLPRAKCIPEGGICYSSLSHGGGQVTAQLGCWPSQYSQQLAWLGVPECKHEVGRLICLCLETNCNNYLPSVSDIVPEGNDVQAGIVGLLVVALVSLVVVAFYLLLAKRHVNGPADMENSMISDDSSSTPEAAFQYPVRVSSSHICPPTQAASLGMPAPLLRMFSAPSALRSHSQSVDQLSSDWSRVCTRMTEENRHVSWPILLPSKEVPLKRYQTFTKSARSLKRLEIGSGLVRREWLMQRIASE